MPSPSSPPRQAVASIDRDQLSGLLSPSLGDDKALKCVREAMRSLGLSPHAPMSVDTALDVLETIAQEPGIVGVTARFAKSRVHLMT